jgi:hypothetical protein
MRVVEEGIFVVEYVDVEAISVQQATGDAEKDPCVGFEGRPAPNHDQQCSVSAARGDQPQSSGEARPYRSLRFSRMIAPRE